MSKYAPADGPFDHDAADSPESLLIGGAIQENRGKVAAANPITYVSGDDPPFLIMHGDKDNLVPYQQSQLLHDALQAKQVPVTLTLVPGAGHGLGGPAVNEAVTDFLARTIGVTGSEQLR
jgi:dipeptidyl aminopeptidase/acylaminoacyl peptidase